MLGDVGILATTAGLTFLVNNYVLSEKEMKQYTGHLAGLLASSLFYPFQVDSKLVPLRFLSIMLY